MSAHVNEKHTLLPPADLEGMLDLSRFLDGLTAPAALLGPDGQQVPLPLEAFNALRDVVQAMRMGKAITVAPLDQMLTTQEVANFLGVSRPTVVKLLEEGHVPYEHTAGGRHRRVRLDDLLTYQRRNRDERRSALDELTSEAVDAGLYEMSAADYTDALKTARSERASH